MKPTDADKRGIAGMAAVIYAAMLIRTASTMDRPIDNEYDRTLKREAVSDAAEILFNARQIESIHADSIVYCTGHRE